MSWEAVTWATKQKLKKSHEQLVLLVLANCADPDGEAFSKWSYREHWWRYLSRLTRLPRSSLFRHLNTLTALGLCSKSLLVLADGARRPTLTLDFTASFDIEDPADVARYQAAISRKSDDESHPETDDEIDEDQSQTNNDIREIHDSGPSAPDESHPETEDSHSHGREQPFPIVGIHKKDSTYSKDSPLPPSGGESAPDELWEQFVRSWGEIPKMTLTRTAWNRIPTTKRAEVVASSKGYWAFRRAQSKPPTPPSAQSFLRDSAGWAQWLRYVPSGDGNALSITLVFSRSSPEGRAIEMLYEIAGASEAFHKINLRSDGSVSYRRPITPRLLALADVPPKDAWVTLSYQQAAAWENKLLRDAVTVQVRHRLHEGSRAPWLWPPNIDGNADPPLAGLSDQELADFK